MLTALANHNEDIKRLLDKGYALQVDSAHLVVQDIPYLNDQGQLCFGAIVCKLVFIDQHKVQQQNHQVFFSGTSPHGLDGKPIPNLAERSAKIALVGNEYVVRCSFSNKPKSAFPDFFAKVEHYVALISGPAIDKFGVTPLTYRADLSDGPPSVFKFQDTLTSRAEIGDLVASFKDEVVALIGLGGTGSYLLDLLVKTPFKEIRAFDNDHYHVHNAYRSPGKLDEGDLGKTKAEVFLHRYDNFRDGLTVQAEFIDADSVHLLEGVTFAFVCVDKGSSRSQIFDVLMSLGIPFIDVGLGLDRKRGALAGQVRTTVYEADKAQAIRDMQLAEMVDDPDDMYRKNVQIAELNALNACLALIRYKQMRGFYVDDNAACNLLFAIGEMKIFSESTP